MDEESSTGDLANKNSVGSYAYNAPRQETCTAGMKSTILHAVMTAGTNSYWKDRIDYENKAE